MKKFAGQKFIRLGMASLFSLTLSLGMLASNCAGKAYSRELETRIVDNLSSELGFPIYSWSSTSDPQAVVLAIHGATLHGTSYTTLAQRLSQKGYATFAPDLRGFGAWYHNSEDADSMARHVLYRQSEKDLKSLLDKLHELYPNKPIYLMGESVGANFAIKLLANYPDSAQGMILSSPAVKQRIFLGPSVFKQIFTVFFVHPSAQLDITPYLRSRVSESPEIIAERVNDPLARNKMNAGELFKTRWFNKECIKQLPQIPTTKSVLVIEGQEDKLFDAEDIKNMMAQIPCEDKTLHMLKGIGHINLETDFMKNEVESVVEDWLAAKSRKFMADSKSNAATATVSSSIDSNKTRILP